MRGGTLREKRKDVTESFLDPDLVQNATSRGRRSSLSIREARKRNELLQRQQRVTFDDISGTLGAVVAPRTCRKRNGRVLGPPQGLPADTARLTEARRRKLRDTHVREV